MLTEDYVSFEIAKLLKEKGFDEHSIFTIYDENAANAYIKELQEKHLPYNSDDPKLKEFYYTQPTLQMAMKWLREVHNISIEPLVDFGSGEEYWWTADVGYIKKDGLVTELCGYDSYEEATEAALKYCLENLI